MNYEVKNVEVIADWFLHVMPMTHKKLQMLLYFSYGIYLAQNNDSKDALNNQLFENNFEAWEDVPVDPSIYNIYRYCGTNLIYKEEVSTFNFSREVFIALNTAIDLYGIYDTEILEDIPNPEQSCKNTSSTNKLNDEEIYDNFYEILNEEI